MDFKDAIATALNIVKQFYGQQANDYRLEEITTPPVASSGDWEITIGFLMPERTPRKLHPLFAAALIDDKQMERIYKRVFLDSETGEFKKMENRLTV